MRNKFTKTIPGSSCLEALTEFYSLRAGLNWRNLGWTLKPFKALRVKTLPSNNIHNFKSSHTLVVELYVAGWRVFKNFLQISTLYLCLGLPATQPLSLNNAGEVKRNSYTCCKRSQLDAIFYLTHPFFGLRGVQTGKLRMREWVKPNSVYPTIFFSEKWVNVVRYIGLLLMASISSSSLRRLGSAQQAELPYACLSCLLS